MRAVSFALALCAASPALAVSHGTAIVNGITVDQWRWTDSAGLMRSVSLKREGSPNSGHGGYAVQFTYVSAGSQVTINAAPGGDGGFGYFVSHERYRAFADGQYDTIASRIFHRDDSPLGLGFAASSSLPAMPAGSGAQRFTITYGHYGTIKPVAIDPNTGDDSPKLSTKASNFAFYPIPVSITWVFQDGKSFPRIDIELDLSQVSAADLVSFDMRGPYGAMLFDGNEAGIVDSVMWGDRQYQFSLRAKPATRSTAWSWNVVNHGTRYHALLAGAFEMGLFEPAKLGKTALADGYAAERGSTSAGFAASGGQSFSACPAGQAQILPSDGTWPYQSLQYSLPCDNATGTTTGKKLAWGSAGYYGNSITAVYNGRKSYPIAGFPANHVIAYSTCVVLGKRASANAASLTRTAAASYALSGGAGGAKADCARTAVP